MCAGRHAWPSGEGLPIPIAVPAQGQGKCPRGWGRAAWPEPSRHRDLGALCSGARTLLSGHRSWCQNYKRDSVSGVGNGARSWVLRTTLFRPHLAKVRKLRPGESREFSWGHRTSVSREGRSFDHLITGFLSFGTVDIEAGSFFEVGLSCAYQGIEQHPQPQPTRYQNTSSLSCDNQNCLLETHSVQLRTTHRLGLFFWIIFCRIFQTRKEGTEEERH